MGWEATEEWHNKDTTKNANVASTRRTLMKLVWGDPSEYWFL